MARYFPRLINLRYQFADQATKSLVFGAVSPKSKKAADVDLRKLATRWLVCLMQNEHILACTPAQPPFVAIFALVDLALICRHVRCS